MAQEHQGKDLAKPEQYVASPEAAMNALLQTFWQEIERRLADPEHAPALMEAMRSQSQALEEAHQDWIVDEPARYNLKITAAVLAAYRVLQDRLPHEELLALLREALIGPFREMLSAGTAQMLDHAPDPFLAMVELSRAKQVNAFGAGFTFELARDDQQAFLVNVTRCFYHNFFLANGAPELTPIFCDFDAPWMTAIDPARHGFRFERPTTIGYGGTMCPFHFRRTTGAVHTKADQP
jgi:hypothetical protein